jgi:hypothetical protein
MISSKKLMELDDKINEYKKSKENEKRQRIEKLKAIKEIVERKKQSHLQGGLKNINIVDDESSKKIESMSKLIKYGNDDLNKMDDSIDKIKVKFDEYRKNERLKRFQFRK